MNKIIFKFKCWFLKHFRPLYYPRWLTERYFFHSDRMLFQGVSNEGSKVTRIIDEIEASGDIEGTVKQMVELLKEREEKTPFQTTKEKYRNKIKTHPLRDTKRKKRS